MEQARVHRSRPAGPRKPLFEVTAKQLAAALLTLLAVITITHSVKSQDTEPNVAAGADVEDTTERTLGLVTVDGGCSGTMLNQFWVLTARHCLTVDGRVSSAFQTANQIRVTATWSGRTGLGSRIYDFDVNSAAGSARDRDIVLLYLGDTNLGEVGTQKIFTTTRDGKIGGRLKTTDTLTQYGIGFSTFATDLRTPASGAGVFRSAVFNPTSITATHYVFNMNANNQSGHGGDSGGPSIVTVYGQPNGGIAGVQTTCQASGYVPGAATPPGASSPGWMWATGINLCTYVSTEPFISEIAKVIKEAPLKPPYISQGQVIVPGPSWPFASMYLGWDSGPGYPNAEVYVSMNGGPDIPAYRMNLGVQADVFRQPKIAAVELKLPRNSGTYRFLLKAPGGVTLAVTDRVPVF